MARQGLITGRSLVGAAALSVLATIGLAGTASAHTPTMSRTCTELTVNLHYYPEGADANWVSVTIGGVKVVDHLAFSGIYNPAPFPAAAKDIVVVHVHTKDSADPDPDPTHIPKWAGDFTVAPPENCPAPPPPTTPAPTTPAPTTPAPTTPAPTTPAPTTAKPTSATATPHPTATGPVLASTGGGSSAGLIAGLGGAVVVLGGGLLFLSRRRRDGRH